MTELELARTRWREACQVYHAYHDLEIRRYLEAKDCSDGPDTAWSEAWSAYNAVSVQCAAAKVRVVRARHTLDEAESIARHRAKGDRGGR